MRLAATVAIAAVALLAAGCTGTPEPDATPTAPPPTVESPAPSPESTPQPTFDDVSLPAQFERPVRGGGLERVGPAEDRGAYTRQEVTYRSDETTISGVLLEPAGDGPFPAVVLNHGYIDPAVYVTGQGMAREQDFLAREGWVVLHTDYRGHAASDPAGPLEHDVRLGYARDALAAAKTLRQLDAVDPDRVAMFGRSMGGGVTLNALVMEPDVVDAAVVHASVSSDFVDNLRQFTEPNRPERVEAMSERWGSPEESPGFYGDLSSRTYADRVEAPVLMIHGALDDTCPVEWARESERIFTEEGADVTLRVYDREGHTFDADWPDAMRRTLAFLADRT